MAVDQLRLGYLMAISTAEHYRRHRFVTIVQDTIIGPVLAEFVDMVEHRPFSLIVLAPDPVEVAKRDHRRTKTGYGSFAPERLDMVLRNDTPKLGYWLDSTTLTVTETVDQIVDNLHGPALIT